MSVRHNFILFCSLFCVIAVWEVQCKLTCPDGWTMYKQGGTCIKLFYVPMTWSNSRRACQRLGGDLIVVNSAAKNTFLSKWHKTRRSVAWIGLHRYHRTRFVWLDGNSYIRYSNWWGGEPNNARGKENCVSLVGWRVNWNDFDCAEKVSYICEMDAVHSPPLRCPANWALYGQNCFRIYQQNKTWTDARSYCQSENADLAIIPDSGTSTFISRTFVYKDRGMDIYFGLHDRTTEGIFQWVDTSVQYQYQNWFPDQPNNYKDQDCGILWSDHPSFWADTACSESHHFLCEKPAITYPLICPKGWFMYSEYCFKLYDNSPRNWTLARKFCNAQSGRLATIPDKQIQQFISTQLIPKADKSVWIGLNDIQREGHYVWADSKEKYSYSNWFQYQPNDHYHRQDCGHIWMKRLNKWADSECSISYYNFLCEKTADKSPYVCPPGWSLYNKYCFKLHKTNLNWTEARDTCISENGQLAVIQDRPTSYFLQNEFFQASPTNIWLGLNDIKVEGSYKWVNTKLTINDTFNNWADGQPNDNHNQDCVHIFANNGDKWADSECFLQYSFLCQKIAHMAPCPPGWVVYGLSCFQLVTTKKSWNDARSFCKTQQGHLTSIADAGTNSFLSTKFFTKALGRIWIGLNDIDQEGNFEWVDSNLKYSYTNWYPGQPNNFHNEEDCVHIYEDLKWADSKCTWKYPFVCQMKRADAAYVTTTIPTTSSTTTVASTSTTAAPKPPSTSSTSQVGVITQGFGVVTPGPRSLTTTTPGNSPQQQAQPSSKSSGLSGGAVAGIVIGVLAAFAVAGVAVFFVRKRFGWPSISGLSFDNAAYSVDKAEITEDGSTA